MMPRQTPKLVVEQVTDWDRSTPEEPVHHYTVTRAVNTTVHAIGAQLTKKEVDALIGLGVIVDIGPRK